MMQYQPCNPRATQLQYTNFMEKKNMKITFTSLPKCGLRIVKNTNKCKPETALFGAFNKYRFKNKNKKGKRYE